MAGFFFTSILVTCEAESVATFNLITATNIVISVTVMASLSAYSVTEPLGLTLGSQCALETV